MSDDEKFFHRLAILLGATAGTSQTTKEATPPETQI